MDFMSVLYENALGKTYNFQSSVFAKMTTNRGVQMSII